MLHILWILLKTILIILGIFLGLVLLALLLLLFCPVRYQAQAKKEGEHLEDTQLAARISWLFRAVGARGTFENGEMKLTILIFGIPLDQIRDWIGNIKEKRRTRAVQKRRKAQAKKANKKKEHTKHSIKDQKESNSSNRSNNQKESNNQNGSSNQNGLNNANGSNASGTDKGKKSQPMKMAGESSETSREIVEDIHKTPSQSETEIIPKESADSAANEDGMNSGFFSGILERLQKIASIPARIWNRITSFIKGILRKIKNIKENIGKLQKKVNWWRSFLEEERTKAAISLVLKDGKALIRHILPTKIEGQITFGCEDPAITGTALAALGMTFPLHKNRIQVNPLFDGENRLTGKVSLKGRIYGIVLVKTALEIYINKNIKYVINRWKHKED